MSDSPQFKILPSDDDLNQVKRDLNFYPGQVTDPSTLTVSLVERYNREGYLKGLSILTPNEVAETRSYFDRLLDQAMAEGRDSYSISTAHLKHGRVYDLLTDDRIVALVKDILGENVIGWGSHFFCKMPHDGKAVAWHQDASYWPLTPSKAVTVWLAVDDADIENACMRFVACSHLFGHHTWRPSTDEENNVLNQTVENAEQYGTVVYDELKAGECSLHSDLLLHGSDANESARRRCGLTLRYCTPDVVAGSDWYHKGVLVSGENREGNWNNAVRPRED
ncbi:MAG: phytanoyl-CoA dioxygenase family protein [Planctomycetes bacterium]|nr:phytanoyl-CoA dioxygenase family protein [Planctomycetota bacterium]